MKAVKITFSQPVTLIGGGALDWPMVEEATAIAPAVVAADGAADRLATWGVVPEAIVGDMDSISDEGAWAARTRLVHLDEQDTTDFEKCLYATEAPFYVAAGFTGARVDHMLAVFHGMLRRPEKTVVLVGEVEAMALMPAGRVLEFALEEGAVVSLYPLMAATGGVSEGLAWPIGGLEFRPGHQIGTSNLAIAEHVRVSVDGPGILLMVPRRYLGALVDAVTRA